ncbi:hypothetical protein HYPSUDRAFT_209121 [Hypholoma sublateritium FD-334 SS-4]|uniref:Uncharacterized protein n=1 Tax=Hypholoma sublateritium (strain FD-334 SS-4) TaxID=945553 RepID=A0A0D2NZS6_HYPSF|nr:hypothetical protein HYPSUDRAFT_209121 [Hypholoma sublateritium FD-334 SS-4]
MSSGHGSAISSSQYHQLLARFNESQRENSSLWTRNAALEAKVETLLMAYNMLLTHIPATTKYQPALRREDYPRVRFWTRQDWNAASQEQILELEQPDESEAFPELDIEEGDEPKEPSPAGRACARGKHRSAQGINVAMKYIENEEGTVIDGYRGAEIRRYARSLWVQMALDDKLPKAWGNADATSLSTYNDSMAQRFPELRLCASDWKANMVAIDNYPSWRHNWLKKQNKDSTSKRPIHDHSESGGSSAKKSRTGLEIGNELLAPIPPLTQEGQSAPLDTIPVPTINLIPGTPFKNPHIDPALPQHNLAFTIGNPLMHTSTNINGMWPLPTDSTNRSATPAPYPFIGLATGAPTPAASDLPAPLAMDIANSLPVNRGKGSRMRPTKTTTARNLCAQDWVKTNPQGTTDDFKSYYSSLSDEQKQVWEEKSKAAS